MNLKTIGISSLGIGAIGTVVVGGYYYMNSDSDVIEESIQQKSKPQLSETNFKTIKEVLKDKKPLNTNDATNDDIWKKLIAEHFKSSINSDKKMKIEGIESGNEAINVQIFKHQCSQLFEKTENLENEKNMAENWCTQESPLLKVASSDSVP